MSFCAKCGAERQDEASGFCAKCGTRFAGNLVAQDAATTRTGRHAGSVVSGVVLGLVSGLFGTLGLWVARRFRFVRSPNGDDMFFGSWFGALGGHAVLAVIIVALTAGGSTSSSNARGETVHTAQSTVTAAPAPVVRTAPEILNAVRAVKPKFCVALPDYVEATSRTTYTNDVVTQQQADGQWLVQCTADAATISFVGSYYHHFISYGCVQVKPTTLEVSSVDTGVEVSSPPDSTVLGHPCIH